MMLIMPLPAHVGTQLSQNGVAPLSGLANGTAVSSAADEEDDFGEFEDAASSFGAPSAAASSESARQSHLSAAHGHSQPQPSLTPPVTDRWAVLPSCDTIMRLLCVTVCLSAHGLLLGLC